MPAVDPESRNTTTNEHTKKQIWWKRRWWQILGLAALATIFVVLSFTLVPFIGPLGAFIFLLGSVVPAAGSIILATKEMYEGGERKNFILTAVIATLFVLATLAVLLYFFPVFLVFLAPAAVLAMGPAFAIAAVVAGSIALTLVIVGIGYIAYKLTHKNKNLDPSSTDSHRRRSSTATNLMEKSHREKTQAVSSNSSFGADKGGDDGNDDHPNIISSSVKHQNTQGEGRDSTTTEHKNDDGDGDNRQERLLSEGASSPSLSLLQQPGKDGDHDRASSRTSIKRKDLHADDDDRKQPTSPPPLVTLEEALVPPITSSEQETITNDSNLDESSSTTPPAQRHLLASALTQQSLLKVTRTSDGGGGDGGDGAAANDDEQRQLGPKTAVMQT